MNKSILLSKTFWLNLVFLISAFFPQVQKWLNENPVQFASLWAAAAIIVRFITSGKVTLFSDDEDSGSGFTHSLFLGLTCMVALGLFGLALTSCTSGASLQLKDAKGNSLKANDAGVTVSISAK